MQHDDCDFIISYVSRETYPFYAVIRRAAVSVNDTLFFHNDPFLIFNNILKFCQTVAVHHFNQIIEVIHQLHIFKF